MSTETQSDADGREEGVVAQVEALLQQGDAGRDTEDWRAALRCYHEALWLCRGQAAGAAGALASLYLRIGDLQLYAAGEPEVARGYYEAALTRAGPTEERVRLLCKLAETYVRSPRSLQYLEEAARLAANTRDEALRVWTQFRKAEEMPQVSEAGRARLLSLGQSLLTQPGIPEDWRERARSAVLAHAGELMDEKAIGEQIRQLPARGVESWASARHHYAIADGLRRVGRLSEAIEHALRSAAIYRALGRSAEESVPRAALAHYYLCMDDTAHARAHCQWVLEAGVAEAQELEALGILCKTCTHDSGPDAVRWARALVTRLLTGEERAQGPPYLVLHRLGGAERILRAAGMRLEDLVAEYGESGSGGGWLPSLLPPPDENAPPAELRQWVAENGSDTGTVFTRPPDVVLDAAPYRGFVRLDVPRLMTPVSGDFVLEARIHGGASVIRDTIECRRAAAAGRMRSNARGGGGLLVVHDLHNTLRLFAHVQEPGEVIAEVRQKQVRTTLGRALVDDGPLVLRIERTGSTLRMSAGGGVGWYSCGEVDLPRWDELEVGVYGECPTDLYSIVRSATTRFVDVRLGGCAGSRTPHPASDDELASRPTSSVTGVEGLLATSAAMQRVVGQVRRLAQDRSPVLICGETGTGKELAVRAIHESGNRRDGPFIALNCAAIAQDLLERELFGHVRGAYTGATESRGGLFAAAHGGTLFLDEIGAASEALQLRLLRVVEEQLVRPVGSTRSQPVDVRIAAATNEDLMRAIGEGRFRSDLYYRLRGATVRLPPLRRRPDDIPLLAYHALDLWAQHREGAHPGIAKEAMALLVKYPWPGNVRELISEVQEAASACPDEPIRPRHLSIRALAPQPGDETGDEEGSRLRLLTETLRHTGGNVAEAGRVLGISRSTMYRWLRSVGLR